MPLSRYDRMFGGDAEKAHAAMVERYGPQRGNEVFYATKNARAKQRSRGVLSKALIRHTRKPSRGEGGRFESRT